MLITMFKYDDVEDKRNLYNKLCCLKRRILNRYDMKQEATEIKYFRRNGIIQMRKKNSFLLFLRKRDE